ncbi:hypothetical protein S40288_10589 [Stachybotrys chartarum IBT 40288]|nr:hypothetical protein S40288_10589 [Stachybotrys chartarum IBT 40288]
MYKKPRQGVISSGSSSPDSQPPHRLIANVVIGRSNGRKLDIGVLVKRGCFNAHRCTARRDATIADVQSNRESRNPGPGRDVLVHETRSRVAGALLAFIQDMEEGADEVRCASRLLKRADKHRSMHRWMRQEQWIVQVVADIFRGQYTQGALAVEALGPRPDPEIGYLADDEEAQSDASETDDSSEAARPGIAVASDTFAVGSDGGVEHAGLPDQDSAGQDSLDRNSFDQHTIDQNSSDAEPAGSQD